MTKDDILREVAEFAASPALAGGAYPGIGTVGEIVSQLHLVADDDCSVFTYAATAFFAVGNYEEAVAASEQALGVNPNHALSHIALNVYNDATRLLLARDWYQLDTSSYVACLILTLSAKSPPVIRNMHFGHNAYDANQLYNYVRDLNLYRKYATRIDPLFIYVYAALLALGPKAEFLELGGTLFAAYEKIGNCENLFGCGVELALRPMINVEYSALLGETARNFHPQGMLRSYRLWQEVPPSKDGRVSYSLGVGNYAFEDPREFFLWIRSSRVVVLREQFTLRDAGERYQVMGKRFTFFSLRNFAEEAGRAGYRLRFIKSNPITETTLEPGLTIPTVDLYFVIENLSEDERDRFCTTFDKLDLSLTGCSGIASHPNRL